MNDIIQLKIDSVVNDMRPVLNVIDVLKAKEAKNTITEDELNIKKVALDIQGVCNKHMEKLVDLLIKHGCLVDTYDENNDTFSVEIKELYRQRRQNRKCESISLSIIITICMVNMLLAIIGIIDNHYLADPQFITGLIIGADIFFLVVHFVNKHSFYTKHNEICNKHITTRNNTLKEMKEIEKEADRLVASFKSETDNNMKIIADYIDKEFYNDKEN